MPSVDDLLGPKPAPAAPKAKPSAVDLLGPPPPSPYETNAAFHQRMDAIYGAGRWRDTSDYRTPGHNAEVGGVAHSHHMLGTADAPGAHDIVVPGMPASVAARRLPKGYKPLPEANHLHVSEQPTVEGLLGPAPKTAPKMDPVRPVDPAALRRGVRAIGTAPTAPIDTFVGGPPKPPEPRAPIAPLTPPKVPGYRPTPSSRIPDRGPFNPNGPSQTAPEAPLSGLPIVRRSQEAMRGLNQDFHPQDQTSPIDALVNAPGHAWHGLTAAPMGAIEPILGRNSTDIVENALGLGMGLKGPKKPGLGEIPEYVPEPAKGPPGGRARRAAAPEAPQPLPPPTRPPSTPPSPRTRTLAETGGPDLPAVAVRPPSTMDVMRDTGHAMKRIVGAAGFAGPGEDTALAIRRSRGEHQLMADQATHDLMQHTRLVDTLPPENKRAIMAAVEGYSTGAHIPSSVRSTVETIRKTYKGYQDRIQYVMSGREGATEGPKFIDDYFTHMWKQSPEEVQNAMAPWLARQGSGRNLKARSIPTIEDGIAAGLEPVTDNPLEMTSLYATNMSRFLTTHDVLNHLDRSGISEWVPENQIPEGYTKLDGIMTEKPGTTIVKDGEVVASQPKRVLVAPYDAAVTYNNWISKGFDAGKYAPLYRGTRSVANAATALKLGLSGYHAFTVGMESMSSAMAQAINAAARGQYGRAGRALAGFGPQAIVRDALRGRKMEKELLGIKAPDSMSGPVNEAFISQGGQLRMDPIYRTRGSGSFYDSFKRGAAGAKGSGMAKFRDAFAGGSQTFASDLKKALKATYTGNMLERGNAVADLLGNTLQAVTSPLFEDVIPNVKRGAFANLMEDWIAANPGATEKDIQRAAVKIGDSIDNRFGEMVQDNLFWDKHLKQTLQIAMLSPSWNIGTLREIGGGILDLPKSAQSLMKGEGISQRTAYVLGMAITVATANAVLQYLMTGKPPESARDLMAARTGGTVPAAGGQYDERLLLPGNQKDVYGAIEALSHGPQGVAQEMENKLNPAPQEGFRLLNNEDWNGDMIYRPPGVPAKPGDPTFGDVLKRELPIAVNMQDERKQGTRIPKVATLLGVRPAPRYLADPEGAEAARAKALRRKLDMQESRQRKQKAMQEQ